MTKVDDKQVTSPDLNQERLQELKDKFPDLFTDEGELDPKALRQLVEQEEAVGREQYAFTWRGKAKSKRHAFTPSRAALTYDPERSVNPEKSNGNLIIEGENLEVLKLLTAAYRGKVKCIYIDPPYNKDADVIYKDNYAQTQKEYWEEAGSYKDGVRLETNPESRGRYHSDWLSMMYGRLLIARQLLREDGVIFVSIDDNEIHNLRRLMDEVFGEENFATQFVWQSRLSKQNDTDISNNHEYIVSYARIRRAENRRLKESNIDVWHESPGFAFYPLPLDKDRFANPDNDPRGPWKADPFDAPNIRENLTYKITNPNTGAEYWPPEGRCWRTEQANYLKLLEDKRILFGKTGKSRPQLKVFYEEKKMFGEVETTCYDGKSRGTGSKGTKELMRMFDGKKLFDFPKPVSLVKSLLRVATREDDIVLDFFAGSGTTAHAIMELNREDNTKRKFILVQLPEAIEKSAAAYKEGYRTISGLCIARCNRAVSAGSTGTEQNDTGFKVYRLAKSNFPRAEFVPDPDKSEEENVKALEQYIAEKESSFQMTLDGDTVLDEVLLKHGFPLDYSIERQEQFAKNTVYLATDGERKAFVCLDSNIDETTIDHFKTNASTTFICLERALDTTKKWNLNHSLGERLKAL